MNWLFFFNKNIFAGYGHWGSWWWRNFSLWYNFEWNSIGHVILQPPDEKWTQRCRPHPPEPSIAIKWNYRTASVICDLLPSVQGADFNLNGLPRSQEVLSARIEMRYSERSLCHKKINTSEIISLKFVITLT